MPNAWKRKTHCGVWTGRQSDALTRIALPYGLASDVYRDADDNYRVKKFRDLYIAALEEAVRGEGETVVDVYA